MTGEAAADEVFCICTFNTISQTANPPTTSVAAVAEVFNALKFFMVGFVPCAGHQEHRIIYAIASSVER